MGDSNVEDAVRQHYDTIGWVGSEGHRGEDRHFRLFSAAYYPYHDEVDRRTIRCFARLGRRLLMAGCGDLPGAHIDIAKAFDSVCCVDISRRALEIAEHKLGPRADYLLASIVELPQSDASFDAVFCAHCIYHVDKDLQEKAVRQLVRVTRSGGRVVVIYANPTSIFQRVAHRIRRMQAARHRGGLSDATPTLYYHAYPLSWWQRFKDQCGVTLLPWDVISASNDRLFLRREWMARAAYRVSGWYESRNPTRAVMLWQYPIIVLDKR